MRRFLSVLGCALIIGCGSGGVNDAKVVGTWSARFYPKGGGKPIPGATFTFDESHHFREVYRNLEITGSWKTKESEVIVQVEALNGKPVGEVKEQMLAKHGGDKQDKANRSIAENLEKPMSLTLAPDGKTMAAGMDEAAGGQSIYTKQ